MPPPLGESMRLRPVLGQCVGALVLLALAPALRAGEIPEWLPRYDLGIQLDTVNHRLTAQERVTFTNRHARPAGELVFNCYSRYKIPDDEVTLLAKTLELLRARPGDGIDFVGRRLQIQSIKLDGEQLPFHFRDDLQTALVVSLPKPVQQGESITLDIEFTLDLPEKQGRWGHWKGVTFLANWYPVLAYHDETGWQPVPFVAWHQPFFNESGVYSVRLTLPADQKIASTGSVHQEEDHGDGTKTLHIVASSARDFTIVCSDRFQEHVAQAETARVRVLAFPEHEHLARKALEYACEVIPLYNRWFGRYPYDEFEIVESHFPWNGNECSGMILIDERVFGMPHLGEAYVDHLVSHETLHQWWYNVVGTNGYAETFMDEGIVSFYTAKRLQMKYGKNAPLLRYPRGFQWLPNIHHEDYRFNGMYGTLARNEGTATIQPLPAFGNLVTLFSMTYDRGAKILGMIEDRLGEQAFYDFMRIIYGKYQFRILRVADYQRELEEYTGRSWEEFFQNWLYTVGMSDWAVQCVQRDTQCPFETERPLHRVVVTLVQQAEFPEPTVLGVKFKKDGPYEVRIPVVPAAGVVDMDLEAPSSDVVEMLGCVPKARIEPLPHNQVRVELFLRCQPVQISVDPDQVLLDRDPSNNHWKPEINRRITPLFTNLDKTDLTTAYDRWNVIAGPWFGWSEPAFGWHSSLGLRGELYRLQHFKGGVYLGYVPDYQDFVAGADAVLDHWPLPHMQVGVQYEYSLTEPDSGLDHRQQGRVFGRYVIHHTPSLYQDQTEFIELYGRYGSFFWRDDGFVPPGAERFDTVTAGGVRYYRNYLTPYWDPETGYRLDLNAEAGWQVHGSSRDYQLAQGELSVVKCLPDGLGYLSQTRLAARLLVGGGLPDSGELFQLGGPTKVRGLTWDDREGSFLWIASLEWRLPIWREMDVDLCDHIVRFKHLYGAAFYDAGAVYLNGRTVDGVAHSVGLGLRLDVALFSFIERATLRVDAARVVNDHEPWQVWFGVQYPF